MGKSFLIAVDAHSKWPEVIPMSTTTAEKTVSELRKLFATHGLPEQIVSDNGAQFTSQHFEEFMKLNGIKHISSAPYHPATNGEAERFVQTFKHAMKASMSDGGSLEMKLYQFLLAYRTTPNSTTKLSPAELLFNRQLRTRISMMTPSVESSVVNKQAYQKSFHDRRGRWRRLEVGQTVLVENPAGGTKWVSGVIIEKLGSTSYEVQVGTRVWKRHIDQLLKGGNHMQAHADEEPDSLNSTPVDTVPTTETVESAGSQNIETSARNSDTQEVQDTVSTDGSTSQTSTTNVDSTTNMQTEGCQNNATLQRSGTPSKSTPTPAVVQNRYPSRRSEPVPNTYKEEEWNSI